MEHELLDRAMDDNERAFFIYGTVAGEPGVYAYVQFLQYCDTYEDEPDNHALFAIVGTNVIKGDGITDDADFPFDASDIELDFGNEDSCEYIENVAYDRDALFAMADDIVSYPCDKVIAGRTYYDLADCADYGCSDCPITMGYGRCHQTVERLEDELSYKWR